MLQYKLFIFCNIDERMSDAAMKMCYSDSGPLLSVNFVTIDVNMGIRDQFVVLYALEPGLLPRMPMVSITQLLHSTECTMLQLDPPRKHTISTQKSLTYLFLQCEYNRC